MEENIWFKFVIPSLIVLVGLILSFTTDILKDTTLGPEKPYSFARVQLMWWTLIIISCFTSYYGRHGELQELDSSALILLGISIGTTTAARIIDNKDIDNQVARHQEHPESKYMLYNIVSDNNGISVHRFQALVFNIVFGLMFIAEFLKEDNKFVEFGAMELGLMGISSAAYVGLKINENSRAPVSSTQGPGVVSYGAIPQEEFRERDLMDIDEAYSQQQFNNQAQG